MDKETKLYQAVKTNNPDYIKSCINEEPAYLRSIIDRKRSGFLLHVAAKYDTRNNTEIVALLLHELGADPNLRNSGDSLPLYWALAELQKWETPSFTSVETLINHPEFSLYAQDQRGSPYSFIKQHYLHCRHAATVKKLLEKRLWADKALFINLWVRNWLPLT